MRISALCFVKDSEEENMDPGEKETTRSLPAKTQNFRSFSFPMCFSKIEEDSIEEEDQINDEENQMIEEDDQINEDYAKFGQEAEPEFLYKRCPSTEMLLNENLQLKQ